MAQQLYDLLGSHYPFGKGSISTSISSDPCVRASCSGSSGSTSLTVTNKSGTFSNGDIVIIHQSRGGNTTNWQVNQIVSGASGSTFTLLDTLDQTFTTQTGTSSALRAQISTVPQYLDLTMNSFTGVGWRASASYNAYGWGGLTAVAVRGTLTISGTPNLNGQNGWPSTSDHNGVDLSAWPEHGSVVGGGFRPGWNSIDSSLAGAGEGYTGSWTAEVSSAQGNGAGASSVGNGGGNGTVGVSGNGSPGGTAGNASLTSMFMGGGGSGAKAPGQDGPASGGGGGGIFVIWAKTIEVTGGLQAKGGAGGNTTNPPFGGSGVNDGGGGAGGSILINCDRGIFGNSLVVATGGTGHQAGAGGSGRIRINYASTITGSTNPVASTDLDRKLRVPSGMIQII